jgi:Family of unknown function (DUF6226)
MSHWGAEGPPDEAYSRVTNSERFAPLHSVALNHLLDLSAEFDVEMCEGLGLDPELEKVPTVRSSVRLVPANSSSASLTVVFTPFPGLFVRFGRWAVLPFPACGCDACAETLEEESARFSWSVTQLVNGRFRESIERIPGLGLFRSHEFWSPDGARSGAKALIDQITPERLESESQEWLPWQRKVPHE